MTRGNPDLDPSDTERFAIGAEARQGPLFADVEWYQLSRDGLPGQNSADWAMRNLDECEDEVYVNCIDRTGGDITIHDGYANVVENGLSGVNARLGWGFRTNWGVVGMRAAWRHVADADLRIAGEEDRLAIPKNIIRVGIRAQRGGLSATWTVNYRTGYDNREGTGEFEVLDRPRRGAGLGRADGPGRLAVNGRRLQPHRRRSLVEHRQPPERGRAHGGRLGAHLLPHLQHEFLGDYSE